MHKCTNNGKDKLNLWLFCHSTFKCDLDLQPAWTNVSNGTSTLQGENCAKLFWNICINVEVMVKTSSIYDHFTIWSSTRAREIDKCQSVRQISKWSAISGRTYGNSRLEAYVRIHVTFEFWKSRDRGYRREFWCIYLYIAVSLFTKYLSTFLNVLSAERLLKQNKNTSEFPRINSCCFRRQAHSSSSVRVRSVK